MLRVRPNLFTPESEEASQELEALVRKLYENLSSPLAMPQVATFCSPKQAAIYLKDLKLDATKKLNTWVYGSMLSTSPDVYYDIIEGLNSTLKARLRAELAAEYKYSNHFISPNVSYMIMECRTNQKLSSKERARLYCHNKLASLVNFAWYFKEQVVFSRYPLYNFTKLVDGTLLLHNESKPVVQYADGWNSYFLNGTLVPATLVKTPAEKIPVADWMIKYKNAEVRKELAKKVGPARIEDAFQAEILDTWEGYTLYSFQVEGLSRNAHCLRMQNPSIDEEHWEYVHPKCQTIQAALAWRLGDIKWNPSQLT